MTRSRRSWSSTRGSAVARLVVIEASERAAVRGPEVRSDGPQDERRSVSS
jgi:hypothetical protein